MLYIFQTRVIFESNVFGSKSVDMYRMAKITSIDLVKGNLIIEVKKQKNVFTQVKDVENFHTLLNSVWTEIRQKTAVDNVKSKGNKKKKVNIGAAVEGITMTEEDWSLLLTGAKLLTFSSGQCIIQEGQEHQRIFQIAKGRVIIKKATAEGEKTLGFIETGSLFGEMTFLEKGKATASVVTEGEDVSVYVIEGYFINILFVDHPHLAGRFYSYLCSILAMRLSDRESQIQKEGAARKRSRGGGKKTRVATENNNNNNNNNNNINNINKDDGKQEKGGQNEDSKENKQETS